MIQVVLGRKSIRLLPNNIVITKRNEDFKTKAFRTNVFRTNVYRTNVFRKNGIGANASRKVLLEQVF